MFTGYRNMTRGGYGENGILSGTGRTSPDMPFASGVRVITGEHG